VGVPNELPQLEDDLCFNERIYHITPSSIHGSGLFSMDDIKLKDGEHVELMEYVRTCYNYGYWLRLVGYMPSMFRYVVVANNIQLKYHDHNKGELMYIYGRLKVSGNIAGIINSTRPITTRKKLN